MWATITKMFDRRITLGNVATIVVFLVVYMLSFNTWYAKVNGHVADTQIHQTIEQKQRLMDERIHLIVDPKQDELIRRLNNVEISLNENTVLLHEIKGQLKRER